VTFSGGGGRDTAAYTRTGQDGSFEVRVTKADNLANDGRFDTLSGFRDADGIQNDVEHVIGSPMRDVIDGSRATSSAQVFEGLAGDDVMIGNTGDDVFVAGTEADGADVIEGGAGKDAVDYSGRAEPVTVRLGNGVADDGEAGERDAVAGVEVVRGGGDADELVAAPNTLRTPHELYGGPGPDVLEGGDGGDTLDGGPSSDVVKGFAGSDRLHMRDGLFDSFIDCGIGSDSVVIDQIDKRVGILGCEQQFSIVGRARLVPRAPKVRAGGVARLELTWTHPRGWRELDEVRLLLEHRGRRIGRIAFDQESGRVRGGGRGVRLAGARTAAPRGRSVSVRLALRIARVHAGRTLTVKVDASEDDGTRQAPARAGRIRVLG
jgi:hypothetical protein